MNRFRCCCGLGALAAAVLLAAPVRAQKGPGELTAKDFQEAVRKDIQSQQAKKDDQSRAYQAAEPLLVLNDTTASRITYDPDKGVVSWRCPLKPEAMADKDVASSILQAYLQEVLTRSKLLAPGEEKKLKIEAVAEEPAAA